MTNQPTEKWTRMEVAPLECRAYSTKTQICLDDYNSTNYCVIHESLFEQLQSEAVEKYCKELDKLGVRIARLKTEEKYNAIEEARADERKKIFGRIDEWFSELNYLYFKSEVGTQVLLSEWKKIKKKLEQPVEGKVSDVKTYDRALKKDEIKSLISKHEQPVEESMNRSSSSNKEKKE